MKVEVKEEKKEQEVKFPCLMKSKSSGNIVLFSSESSGVVIYVGQTGHAWSVGDHCNSMEIVNFKPFNGSITLSND